MATYRDLLKLVREGKSNQEIQDAMKISTLAMQRMLSGKKIQRALAADREMTALLATHRLVTATERIVERCLQLIEADNDETARRVSMELLERARVLLVESRSAPGIPMERQQTQELLKRMADAGIIHERYTQEGRDEYNWEWALREKRPLKVDFRKVEYGDKHYLDAFDKFKRDYRVVRQEVDRKQKEVCNNCELRKRCKEIKQGCLKPPPSKPVTSPPAADSSMGVPPMSPTGILPVSETQQQQQQEQQKQQRNNEDRAETALEHTGETPVPHMGKMPMPHTDKTPMPRSDTGAAVRRKPSPAIIHSPVSGMPYNGPRRPSGW